MQTRVNGRAIEDYKRFDVLETGLAVPKAEPLYFPAISGGYAPNDFIVDADLVLYLPLYLLKSSKFKSVDRYGHSCSAVGALWRPFGRYHDGTDDYVKVAHNTALQPADMTFLMWAKLTPKLTRHELAMKRLTASAAPLDLLVERSDHATLANKANFNIWDGVNNPSVNSTTAWADSKWHLFGAGRDTTTDKISVFLDGALDCTPVTDTTTGAITNTDDLYIGSRQISGSKYHLLGDVGEVWLYKRVLSVADLAVIYNATAWRYQ